MADGTLTIAGSLGSDPVLRFTAGARAVTSFSVAVSHRFKPQDKDWVEETTWMSVTAWGDLGEHVAASCSKGTRVIVSGRISMNSYEKDGQTIERMQVIADDIGVSLKWATAEVERITRDKAENGGTTQRAQKARAAKASDPIYSDEEPF